MNEFFCGYNAAIINAISAIMQMDTFESDKTRSIKAVLSVADTTNLPKDLFVYEDKEEARK